MEIQQFWSLGNVKEKLGNLKMEKLWQPSNGTCPVVVF